MTGSSEDNEGGNEKTPTQIKRGIGGPKTEDG